ncbi:CU044_5270 family protein [Nonomuraea helvata]|uniref:CU044_5270 family protein n=1 Tax=Nonomuraea helvata TaxID=37484 RepID=A0ABV5RRB4_9ACTN
MMDEIKNFRGATPTITRHAENAARARLLHAMQEPTPASPRRRTPRLAWRLVLAAALAGAVGTGAALIGDGGQPAITPVASVRDLGERAARAAATDHYRTVPSPGKWLYVKETIAPLREEPAPDVDPGRRTTLELWNSVDGRQTALDDGKGRLVIEPGPGTTAADLAKAPVTPEQMLTRIKAGLGEAPPGDTSPEDQRIFETISQLMSGQVLEKDVRAALFRALPMIPGMSIKQDAVDAAGRHGVAFAYTGPEERFEIILNPEDYRYLGTYGESLASRTHPKAGVPLVWTAQLEAEIVDKPGARP